MSTNAENSRGRTFAGWTALLGVLLGIFNIASFLAVTGGDIDGLFNAAKALSLGADSIRLFHWSMIADSLAWYLMMLVVGGYMWGRLRAANGALIDIATLGLGVYATLGLVGTSIQAATLPVLASMHQAGDATMKAATEASWSAVAQAAQHGVWWIQQIPSVFWALVVGTALRRDGKRHGWLLTISGVANLLFFLAIPIGKHALGEVPALVALFSTLGWMAWAGISLLRERDAVV